MTATTESTTSIYAYDSAGRVVSVDGPAGNEMSFRYETDPRGRVKCVHQRLADGCTIIRDLDPLGREVVVQSSGPASSSTLRYERDGIGRVIKAEWDGGGTVHVEHDTRGRVTALAVGAGFIVAYVYDFLARIERIKTPVGDIAYEYHSGAGRRVRRLPNGVWTVFESRPDGSLDSITHANARNEVLLKLSYVHGPDGRVTEIEERSPQGRRTVTNGYDTSGRLVSVVEAGGTRVDYSYDTLGNRTAVSLSERPAHASRSDWAGRLVEFDGRSCDNDAAGNLARFPGTGGDCQYAFDARNLLVSASTPQGKVGYEYDGQGALIARTSSQGTVRFVPDPLAVTWRPLLARDERGHETFYVWDGETLLAEVRNGDPAFLLHDHLGSVRLCVDARGEVVASHRFDAFGNPDEMPIDATLVPAFAGLFFDPVSSVAITRGRSYVPSLGRFLQVDPHLRIPAGAQEDLPPYGYCGADPVNRVDRRGHASDWVWGPQNAIWQAVHTAFNTTYSHQFWAQQSESAISAGNGYLATFYDAVGGYVPGPAATMNQAFAASAWSLVPGAGMVHTVASLAVNIFQGRGVDAAWNALSVAGTGLGIGGQMLGSSTRTLASGQLEFISLVNPVVSKWAQGMSTASEWVDVVGHYENAYDVYEANTQTWPSPNTSSPQLPTNVGGIYLQGAGRALEGMGSLRGLALDADNGRLILLSEDRGDIVLPPLRLDDVVTIFRSVYEHGEAPFVSIDPKPDDPHGPIMLTRHGEATANTYVGWVMFEADRVMKAYSLGTDNVTGHLVRSGIDGYHSLLDSGYSGQSQREHLWERFWIVPASVTRRESSSRELTLFDVPLRVMTQRMVLRNGKLEPAPNDTPSPQARAFAEWFTTHYDELSKEALSVPPDGAGATASVSFFHELRRVALITAIAERLCQQGVPMPRWMAEYDVAPCRLDPTTPAITATRRTTETVEKKKWWGGRETFTANVERQIYGGVNLAPDDADVRTVAGDSEADRLASRVREAASAAPPFEPVAFEANGMSFRAAALPGDDTRALGACVLRQSDLGGPAAVERVFHSFFRPSGEFGVGWTLDLPRLQKHKRVTERQGDRVQLMTVHQLVTPLASVSARFDRRRNVPEAHGELLVAEGVPEILGLASDNDQRIGCRTDVVLFRDGRRWHFDESGNLVARVQAPRTVIYRRKPGAVDQLSRVEEWYGNKIVAQRDCDYDDRGRIARIRGREGREAVYVYNPAGELVEARGPSGVLTYEYADGCIARVLQDGVLVQSFGYADRGTLSKEWRTETGEIDYAIQTGPDGTRFHTSAPSGGGSGPGEIVYDSALRPVREVRHDGTDVRWDRSEAGKTRVTVSIPGGDELLVTELGGGSRRVELPGGSVLEEARDAAERLTSLTLDGKTLMRQQWHVNGQPEMVEDETTAWRHEYRADGTLSRVLVTPPGDASGFSAWLGVGFDESGRLTGLTDATGMDVQVGYDAVGNISFVGGSRARVDVTRDEQARSMTLRTSWGGSQTISFDAAGRPTRVETSDGSHVATTAFEGGRPVLIRHFDGGEVQVGYEDSRVRRLRLANGIELGYDYDVEGRVAAVSLGDETRVEYAYDDAGRIVTVSRRPVREAAA
jgi:RHS repeat-associated protein